MTIGAQIASTETEYYAEIVPFWRGGINPMGPGVARRKRVSIRSLQRNSGTLMLPGSMDNATAPSKPLGQSRA